jgi:hyperosmotically inducible periplasmic protein
VFAGFIVLVVGGVWTLTDAVRSIRSGILLVVRRVTSKTSGGRPSGNTPPKPFADRWHGVCSLAPCPINPSSGGVIMKRNRTIALLSLVAFGAVGAAQAASNEDASTRPELSKTVRETLERLPYYGVFDILNFQVNDNGVVELGGYVYRDALREEAERAVSKVDGVKQVVNRIEELDWGVLDDEIRAKVYLSIYRDSFLSRYGTATDMALANGIGYGPRGRFSAFGPAGLGNPFFPGFNPAGEYAIHILVTNGEVILVGEVDNEGDKTLAWMKARGVFPAKKVFNELTVRGENKEPGAHTTPKVKPGKGGVVVIAEAN